MYLLGFKTFEFKFKFKRRIKFFKYINNILVQVTRIKKNNFVFYRKENNFVQQKVKFYIVF